MGRETIINVSIHSCCLFTGPPVITPLAAQIDVGVSSDVTLPCIVQGYPMPVVQWSRLSGDPLPPYSYVLSNNLTITDITLTGGGTYRCSATNSFNTAVVDTIIIVHGMYVAV